MLSLFCLAIRERLNCLLSDSYQNEAELLQLSVIIENLLKKVTYSMFGHQIEARLPYFVIVTGTRLNCFNFKWSLKIC